MCISRLSHSFSVFQSIFLYFCLDFPEHLQNSVSEVEHLARRRWSERPLRRELKPLDSYLGWVANSLSNPLPPWASDSSDTKEELGPDETKFPSNSDSRTGPCHGEKSISQQPGTRLVRAGTGGTHRSWPKPLREVALLPGSRPCWNWSRARCEFYVLILATHPCHPSDWLSLVSGVWKRKPGS